MAAVTVPSEPTLMLVIFAVAGKAVFTYAKLLN
jgi:hypothetical protein